MKTIVFALMALVMMTSLAFNALPAAGAGPWDVWEEVALKLYQNDLKLAEKLAVSIDKANTKDVAEAQAFIAKQKALGVDTTEVEKVLADFIVKVSEAQAYLDKGNALLTAHVGFNDDGTVSDVEKAMDTVMNAQEALMEGNGVLTQARFELAKYIGEWKEIVKSLPQEYRKEKVMLKVTARRLTATDKVVTRTQKYIDTQAGKGKDTTDLVAALDAYKAKVAEAKVDYDNAAAILAAHAGFDDKGKVIDTTAAQKTVDDADAALDGANSKLTKAAKDLALAQAMWRKTHR